MKCNNCGGDTTAPAERCQYCGTPFSALSPSTGTGPVYSPVNTLAPGLLALVLVGGTTCVLFFGLLWPMIRAMIGF